MQLDRLGVPRAADSEAVASSDPLGADARIARLADLNRDADVAGLSQMLRAVAPTKAHAEGMSIHEAIASLRDLGMLMASLKKHGCEPMEVVPEAEASMLTLGEKTKMVPRDTVYHYSVWNPRGHRQRMFLGDPSEEALIEASRVGALRVEAALEALVEIIDTPLETRGFVEGCHTAGEMLMGMVDAIAHAAHRVSSQFFAHSLRSYFEPIRIGGVAYNGAAAAPLSIGVVDTILWSSDCTDAVYREFQDQTMQYNMPCWRKLYRDQVGLPSLATKVSEALEARPGDAQVKEACAALIAPMRVVLTFRGRHRLVAKAAYAEETRMYQKGSGGYGVDTLEHILKLNHAIAKNLWSDA